MDDLLEFLGTSSLETQQQSSSESLNEDRDLLLSLGSSSSVQASDDTKITWISDKEMRVLRKILLTLIC